MRFYLQFIFAQFWACVDFKDASVLTTRGQPFGISMYTNEFWSYREACSDQSSYVNKKVCIGIPGWVFFNKSPAWTDLAVSKNYENIRGSIFMPVIEGDQCVGVLELGLPNVGSYENEMREVCRALEEAGLKSFVQNENISYHRFVDYSQPVPTRNNTLTGSRKSKTYKITLIDITKLFGLPKKIATEICSLSSKNTFSDVHRRFGIDKWPCVRNGVAKSSAHNALIKHGIASYTSTYKVFRLIECINSWLMQDDDNINHEDYLLDKKMEHLISKEQIASADGKRVRDQQLDDSDSPALLELYQHKNKRSRAKLS